MQLKNKKERVRKLFSGTMAYVDNISSGLSKFSADMTDVRHITVRGCKRIGYYSPALISISLGNKYINICGKSLFCHTFSCSDIGVEGDIKCIFFSERIPGGMCKS